MFPKCKLSLLIAFGPSLTEGRKLTFAKAARDGAGKTIRLTHGQFRGDDHLGLMKGHSARRARVVIFVVPGDYLCDGL